MNSVLPPFGWGTCVKGKKKEVISLNYNHKNNKSCGMLHWSLWHRAGWGQHSICTSHSSSQTILSLTTHISIHSLTIQYPPAYSPYINNHLYTSNILIFNKLINVFLFALKLLLYKYFTAIIHCSVIIIPLSQALLFWCCGEGGEGEHCGAVQCSDWLVGSLMNTHSQPEGSPAHPDCGMS